MTQPIDPEGGWTPELQAKLDALPTAEQQAQFMDNWSEQRGDMPLSDGAIQHMLSKLPIEDIKKLASGYAMVRPISRWQVWHFPLRWTVRFKCCEQHGERTYARFANQDAAEVVAHMVVDKLAEKARKKRD